MKIYFKIIENRRTFKIKPRWYLEFLTHETISIDEKIAKCAKVKICLNKKLTEVKLVHFNLFNNTYQLIQEFGIYFFRISPMDNN